MTHPIGTIEERDNSYHLLLERHYAVPIDSVWNALVEPEKLAVWLADVVITGHVGGAFEIDFGGGDKAGGTILAYERPNVLEFEWGELGEASVVRFELAESEAGTHLRLIHRRQSEKMARGTGAGWHAHLDLLELTLLDREIPDYMDLYRAAVPRYEHAMD